MMITPLELTEGLEAIIFDQLREGDKYACEISIPGLNNEFDPWQEENARPLVGRSAA